MNGRQLHRVLLVEDQSADARLTLEDLRDVADLDAIEATHVRTLAEALAVLERHRFDIVLLDLGLPDATGLDAVTAMLECGPDLPIVVLSGLDDERTALEAVLHGAQDYLIKGQVDRSLLRRALRYAIERKRVERELNRRAQYDALTGLANRTLFEDRLREALHRMAMSRRALGVMYLDLDGFKEINDTHGHAIGDEVLKVVASRLTKSVRRTDTVARLGGDEFTVVLQGLHGKADAIRIAETALHNLRRPMSVEHETLTVGASIGLAIAFPGDTLETVVQRADDAMYQAKGRGGNCTALRLAGAQTRSGQCETRTAA